MWIKLVDSEDPAIHQMSKSWLPETTPVITLKKILNVEVIDVLKTDRESFDAYDTVDTAYHDVPLVVVVKGLKREISSPLNDNPPDIHVIELASESSEDSEIVCVSLLSKLFTNMLFHKPVIIIIINDR